MPPSTARAALALALLSAAGAAGQPADPQLLSYIRSIRAVDNHAHVIAPDVADDKGYDALRCEPLPSTPGLPPPANFRFGTGTQLAWKALYGRVPRTADEADRDRQKMLDALRAERGSNYYDWILNESGIDTVLANRIAMTDGLKPPRFRWVPYADALLFPFDNKELETTPDRQALFAQEDELRNSYFERAGVKGPPATLDDYVGRVVLPTLKQQQASGAVAIKFEAAYLRSLDFGSAPRAEADAIYRRSVNGPAPKAVDYTLLQDYLFHVVATEAGRLGLAVHIHTGSGCGEYFDVAGSDPLLLNRVFNDKSLRGTTFVMLHGGSPFERHVTPLIQRPNVFVDTSSLVLSFSPGELARVLRPWLESVPEHILFGTDADFLGPGMGWQETTWLGSRNARLALAMVLTELVKENVVTMPRAKEIADGVLRGNAQQLYRWERR